MADLNDLRIPALTDMIQDEAIETLRQIRLSRRIPKKKQSKSTVRKKQKAKAIPKVTKQQAANLLKILGGN